MENIAQGYCIIEKNLTEHHAGSKARNDVAEILKRNGWLELVVSPPQVRYNANVYEKVKTSFRMRKEWQRIEKVIPEGTTLLLQYPLDMYPKISILAVKYLKKIKEKNVNVVILIHDMDSLRESDQNRKLWCEKIENTFFENANCIIAHNQNMIRVLNERGLSQKMIPLGIFDYLFDATDHGSDISAEMKESVVVAGNLDEKKSGYIYKLDEIGNKLKFSLYGPNFCMDKLPRNSKYMGSYSPDELPEKLSGGFGLVWDGNAIDDCGGGYGGYLRYNNPHKASLYLASGLPIIVNCESAISGLVDEYRLGITVRSLKELNTKILEMSEEEYKEMKKNVLRFSIKLRRGEMLEEALGKI